MSVSSTMLPLGTLAPSFNLPDVTTGQLVSLNAFRHNELLLVIFLCQHCPYVKHIQLELGRLGQHYGAKNVGIVGISSNDVANYPQDSPEHLKRMAEEFNFTFPILYDETQEVAKAYRAACTPEFYLFDAKRALVYRGQLDESRPQNALPVTGKDLRNALDLALTHHPIKDEQKPSIGCNIKWKSGQAPDYFSR
ncbi:MAG TPA: thioredoxin family protein [bacterium]|nr:thioredoxin family protein [bacterium]